MCGIPQEEVMSPRLLMKSASRLCGRITLPFHYIPYLSLYRRVPKKKPIARVTGVFCPCKYKRFRQSINLKKRKRLQPIDEHVISEYLKTDSVLNELKESIRRVQHYLQLGGKLISSIVDRMLNRLRVGWTLRQAFDMRPKPPDVPALKCGNCKLLCDLLFGVKFKRKRPRRKIDYGSVMTEVLMDIYIMNTSKPILPKSLF